MLPPDEPPRGASVGGEPREFVAEAQGQERAALRILAEGGVVGLPTETVYGLAADGTDPVAVAKIFQIKGRPANHPLILHLAEASWLGRYCTAVPSEAYLLADAFWPGPLTLVLARSPLVPDAVTGGLSTVAVRVPAHPVARSILKSFNKPLAAPSANRFGAVSPTSRAHVLHDLGDELSLVLDGGDCSVGIESTIVDLSRGAPQILRPGTISQNDLERVLHCSLRGDDGGGAAAPGTLESHYSPRAEVRIVERGTLLETARSLASEKVRVGVLNAGPDSIEPGFSIQVAPVGGNAEGTAHDLYRALRILDEGGCDVILAELPLEDGIGIAVADRLKRAAYRKK